MQFKSVLIIDNDPICIFLTKREIQRSNIAAEIFTATNGEAALDVVVNYFKEHRSLPEVILSDLNMPVMNGLEFFRRLKRLPFFNPEETIVATITSSEKYEELEMLKKEGMKYVFPKPVLKEYIKSLKLIKVSRTKPLLYQRFMQMRKSSMHHAA